MSIVYALLAAHFIGDFLLQTDWMAVNKSKSWGALSAHVLAYAFVLILVAGIVMRRGEALAVLWVSVNAAAHFVTDAITSRITSQLWFFQREEGIWAQAVFAVPKHDRTIVNPWTPVDGKRHWFFVAIGGDQLIHYVTLLVTAEWWLR